MMRSKASGRTPSGLDRHVGGKLRSARESISETPETLARVMGVSVESYQRMERGEERPEPEALDLAAKLLRVPIAYFFSGYATERSGLSTDAGRPPKPTEGQC
jgi:transcriptional regulator with XRE-family HTH domain